jgi:Hydantoinase B/oxoprolinase
MEQIETDEPVRLRVRVELGQEGVRFDTTGSDHQRHAPVNSTYAMTYSACAYALKCLIDPELVSLRRRRRRSNRAEPSCHWPAQPELELREKGLPRISLQETSTRGQRLGDRAAHTIVVRR